MSRMPGAAAGATDPDFLGGQIPPPHRLSTLYDSPSPSHFDPYSSSYSPSNSYHDLPRTTAPPTPSRYHSALAASAAASATGPAPTGFHPVPTSEDTENPFMPSTQFASNAGHGAGYSTMDSGSTWMEKQEKASKRSKWLVIGSIVGIAAIIAIAVGVGVGVSKSKSKSSSSLAGSSGSTNSASGDPSDFTKNSALKQSFYGIAYTPEGSQLPDCGNSLDQVITDIQLLSQLTTRIRLYGADCNQSALVLEAIKQTKVNMTVFLGNYNIPTDAGAAYVRQRDTIKEALQTYGTDNIGGITVGNEFILNWITDQSASASDVNGAIGDAGAELLIVNITDTRNMLSEMNIDLEVGTSDAGSYFNNKVLEAVDYGMANVHPWFADTTIDDAAAWTAEFFAETDVAAAQALSNNPKMYIAETGWPTNSSSAAAESNGAANASVANLQIFLDDFVCQANTNGTAYFFFEYFDEVWKDEQFGGVEGWWGLFTSDRQLKDGLTIPDCSS